MTTHCRTLISGGRLIDPRNDIDEIASVGISAGRVVHIGTGPVSAEETIDASGLVVAPGFIDLHSHAQNRIGHLLQAFDGVTTSLELECGAAPFGATVAAAAAEGRLLNHGYSAAWLLARMIVMEGLDPSAVSDLPSLPLDVFGVLQGNEKWSQPADDEQLRRIVELVAEQLDDGAIGIGVLLGYAPLTDGRELEALAELAVERGTMLFVHARIGANVPGHAAKDGVAELVDLCEKTGVRIHICHFSSSNAGAIDESAAVLQGAIDRGLPITTESYPFEFASTVIGAEFLNPNYLEATNTPADAVTYLPGAEKVASYERLEQLRAEDPGGLCLVQYYRDGSAADTPQLLRALSFPGAAFASDAMPLTRVNADSTEDGDLPIALPVPPDFAVHPRSGSCFVRAISWLHRDTGLMDLSEVIRRSTDIPATILGTALPSIGGKGHLGVGADADIVVFDLQNLEARTEPRPVAPARGIVHLFVNGEQVIANGENSTATATGRVLLSTPGAGRIEQGCER